MADEVTPASETPAPDETGKIPAESNVSVKPDDLEAIKAALKKANNEAAASRKQLAAIEKAEADRKSAEMSELEKLKAENETLKAATEAAQKAAQVAALKQAFENEARAANWLHPEIAYRLIDDLSEIEIKDGKAIGVSEAVKALSKQYPDQIKRAADAPDIDAGKRSQRVTEPVDEATLREEAMRLGVDPKFYKRPPVMAA